MATGVAATRGDALVEPAPEGLTRSGAARLDAIDKLRGLVIVLMVLDHVRDYFHAPTGFDPTDPLRTTPILFATRWVTHLCATSFVFLAGVSILFQRANGKTPGALARFLVTRGLWLILLEVTVVSFGFNFGEPFVFLQVIWAIGISMVCMSVIALLPPAVVLALGVALVLLSPSLASVTAGASGAAGVLRMVLLAPGIVPGTPVLAMYAAVPWLGVMCLGFGLGPLFRRPAEQRQRGVLVIALALLATFAVLRGLDGFGDPAPWSHLATPARSVMSFLNVSKYPPSRDYVCATLGVSLLLFLALQYLRGPAARVLLDFGRTPLFTYVAHIYLAHGLMLVIAVALGVPGIALDFIGGQLLGAPAPNWGFSLAIVYVLWAVVVLLLILPARWFADVKRRRRDWWLSYL